MGHSKSEREANGKYNYDQEREKAAISFPSLADDQNHNANMSSQQNDHLTDVKTLAASVSEKLVVRSLRRRLCKALMDEDPISALKIYTTTRSEWEEMVCNEIWIAEASLQAERERQIKVVELQESQTRQQNVRSNSGSCTNLNISNVKIPRKQSIKGSRKNLNQQQSLHDHVISMLEQSPSVSQELLALRSMVSASMLHFGNLSHAESQSPVILSDDCISRKGLLQIHMNPTDAFEIDDYKSPFDEYLFEHKDACETSASDQFSENGRDGSCHNVGGNQNSFRLNKYRFLSKSKRRLQENNETSSGNIASSSRTRQAFSVFLGMGTGNRRRHLASELAALDNDITVTTPLFDIPSFDNSPTVNSGTLGDVENGLEASHENHLATQYENSTEITTPLHESARIGCSSLVRMMLATATTSQHLLDCNVRNGMGRSILHSVSGGITKNELSRYKIIQKQQIQTLVNDDVDKIQHGTVNEALSITYGIQVPEPLRMAARESADQNATLANAASASTRQQNLATRKVRKAVKVVGRFFRDLRGRHVTRSDNNREKDTVTQVADSDKIENTSQKVEFVMTEDEYNKLQQERIDTAQILLSWSHPDDGSSNAGMGLSPNAVDSQNRTALHYAAALGRTELCLMLCSQFGTMLTIVDNSSQTPCELAALNHWSNLTAELEARALMYIDPYGTDEELLLAFGGNGYIDGISNDYYTVSPAPPFFWFETYSCQKIQQKREKRIVQAFEKLQQSISRMIESEKIRATILGATDFCDKPSSTDSICERNSRSLENTESCNSDRAIIGVESNDESARHPNSESIVCDRSTIGVESSDESIRNRISEIIISDKVTDLVESNDEGIRHAIESTDIPTDENDNGRNLSELALYQLMNQSHVELFLKFHCWNVKKAVEAFNHNPRRAFEAAKVQLTAHINSNNISPVSNSIKRPGDNATEDILCQICCDNFDQTSPKWKDLSGCQHGFCIECLGDYLTDCAKSKVTGLVVTCPHHECEALLSFEEIREITSSLPLVSDGKNTTVFDMLNETASNHFVQSDPSFRFCPHPGCGGAIRFNAPTYAKASKLTGTGLLELVGAVCTLVTDNASVDENITNFPLNSFPVTYEGVQDINYYDCKVQPKQAHRFCFECGEVGIHWPVPCDRLRDWKEAIDEQVKIVATPGIEGDDYNEVAQKLWMKTNTRQCPSCNVPIQKDEGCNHMTCRNPLCQYEFCWICRKDWKLHSSETGGFFRCNRWVDEREPTGEDSTLSVNVQTNEDINDPRTMEVTYGTAMFDTRETRRKAKEMNRFLHHYQRWNAHIESAELERKMGNSVCARLAPVVREAIRINGNEFVFHGKGLSFVHAAFSELLECRSMLQHSYAMSYFRYKATGFRRFSQMRRRASEQTVFEQFQAELELMTEQISDVVARSHIRASQTQIMFLTKAAAEKRKEFSNVMINILFEEKHERLGETLVSGDLNAASNPSTHAGGILETISGTEDRNQPTTNGSESNVVERAVMRSLQQFLNRSDANLESFEFNDEQDEEIADWACRACTFVNSGGRLCSICGTRR